jgi:UDP-N-acetylmuramate dehydrogenase
MTARARANAQPPLELRDDGVTLSVQRDARTDLYNTFRVGGPADFLTRAGTTEEVALALRWAAEQGLPTTIIGGGSNLLVSDRGVRGLVVLVRRPGRAAESGLELLDEDAQGVTVRVPAAAPTNWLGHLAAERGWTGLAWAVGLPGNVGGAVVNNAGAHGGETKDALLSVRVIDADGQLVEHDRAWLAPRYRWTTIKGRQPKDMVVLDAVFQLARGDGAALRAEADEYAEYRHRTQPTGACAGSIFKNPPGTFSGLLIEQAGLKGLRVGGAVVSDKHANFIVNDGGATAADIVALMARVQELVAERAGARLEPEIERIGDWP